MTPRPWAALFATRAAEVVKAAAALSLAMERGRAVDVASAACLAVAEVLDQTGHDAAAVLVRQVAAEVLERA